MIAFFGMFGHVREFPIPTVEDHTGPAEMVLDIIDLDADLWIRAHPFNLLPVGRKSIEVIGFVNQVDRHDIRLIFARARQSSDGRARHDFSAILCCHFPNSHREFLPYIPALSRSVFDKTQYATNFRATATRNASRIRNKIKLFVAWSLCFRSVNLILSHTGQQDCDEGHSSP